MDQQTKKRVFNWVKIVLIVYALIGILLYTFQEKFLFHPQKLESHYEFDFEGPFEELLIPVNKTDTISMVKFFPSNSIRKGVILYFHGNKNNIEHYAAAVPLFTRAGYELWMPDYPGFGKSTGELTEEKLYSLAIEMKKMASQKFSNDSTIIYGKSLGTGIAAYLASKSKNKLLILETPYYSLPSLVSSRIFIYPSQQMLHFKLPTYEYLQIVEEPVIIFHGEDDRVIPYRNAAKLKSILKPTDKFISLPNTDHLNVREQAEYIRVMEEVMGKNYEL